MATYYNMRMYNLSKPLWLAILLLSIPLSVFSNDCTNIDLRGEALGKVRDQGGIGWCFAYTAADLISYKIGKRVSVSDIATTYFKNKSGKTSKRWVGENIEESGYTVNAIEFAIKGGICLEEDLPSENFTFVQEGVSKTAKTISHALDIMWVTKVANGDRHLEFPHVNQDEVSSLLSNHSLRKAWEKVVERSCLRRRINIKNLKLANPWSLTNKETFRIIDRVLEDNNVISFSYYSEFLRNFDREKAELHESVIVGRRWSTEKKACEYLIRNSWGNNCSSYDKSLTCEEGHIWVPKHLLTKQGITNINYLEQR